MSVRNILLCALAVGLITVLLPALAATDTENHSTLEQKILKVNQEMLDAEMRADIPTLEQFFPDGFVRMTQGGLQDKADFLNAIKNGRNRFMAYELKDVQIRVYGTTAVLAGGFHLKSTNGDTDNLFADVWIQQKGKWQTPAWVTNRPRTGKAIPGDAPVKKTDTTNLSAQKQSLLRINEEMFSAQARADTAALDTLITSDFLRLTVDGVQDKAAFLNDLKTGKTRFEILEPNDVKVHVYGTTAILSGGFRLKDSSSDTQNLFLDVWVQQKGKWKTTAWIADPHPQPGGGAGRQQ